MIASVLGYWIQHKSDDQGTVAVEYHLALERHHIALPDAAIPEEGGHVTNVESPTMNGPPSMTRGGGGAVSVTKPGGEDSHEMFEKEKKLILQNRGWRLKLSQSLTQLWHSLVYVLSLR